MSLQFHITMESLLIHPFGWMLQIESWIPVHHLTCHRHLLTLFLEVLKLVRNLSARLQILSWFPMKYLMPKGMKLKATLPTNGDWLLIFLQIIIVRITAHNLGPCLVRRWSAGSVQLGAVVPHEPPHPPLPLEWLPIIGHVRWIDPHLGGYSLGRDRWHSSVA